MTKIQEVIKKQDKNVKIMFAKKSMLALQDMIIKDYSKKKKILESLESNKINLIILDKLEKILSGESLDDLIDALVVEDRMLKLQTNA